MFNQEFREAYQAARIKHEDAHHSFPFDNCYMPECKAVWEKMNPSNDNINTNPKEQLELLAAHQQDFENLLYALTGLTVKVSLNVHTADNSTDDLLRLYEASLTLPTFKQVNACGRTWIFHKDLGRNIFVFMPKGFDADELYPEPEDLEGYNQAIEYTNAHIQAEHSAAHTDTQEDEIPF